jgi:hypothetical protein
VFCIVVPALRSPAPDIAPSRRAIKIRYSVLFTTYVSLLLAPDVLHLPRVDATAAPVLVWTGSPALVHPILQTSGNDFNANFNKAVRTGDANSDWRL